MSAKCTWASSCAGSGSRCRRGSRAMPSRRARPPTWSAPACPRACFPLRMRGVRGGPAQGMAESRRRRLARLRALHHRVRPARRSRELARGGRLRHRAGRIRRSRSTSASSAGRGTGRASVQTFLRYPPPHVHGNRAGGGAHRAHLPPARGRVRGASISPAWRSATRSASRASASRSPASAGAASRPTCRRKRFASRPGSTAPAT